jgi:F0F1-type ATP synthase membrane subunit a
MASSEALTTTDYIKHHLQNLTFGQHPDGAWGIAHSAAEAKAMGFWAVHLDTMFWSVLLGALFYLGIPKGCCARQRRYTKRPAEFCRVDCGIR